MRLPYAWTTLLVVVFSVLPVFTAAQDSQNREQPRGKDDKEADGSLLEEKVEALLKEAGNHFRRGRYAQATGLLRRAVEVCKRLYPKAEYPDGHPDVAYSLYSLGSALGAQGEYGEARKVYEEALAMQRRVFPESEYPRGHPELAWSLSKLASVLENQGGHG